MEANENCDICLNPVKFYSLGNCNHRDQCIECYLRRKVLYQQVDCPVCREPVTSAIITSDKEKKFKEFDLESWKFIDEYGIYVNEESEKEFQSFSRLWQLKCPYCDSTDFKGLDELKHHTRSVHKLEFCSVCIVERKVFLQEQKLYNQKDLRIHMKSGDRDTLITHAYCQFCNEYLFDQDQLWSHLHKKHETCFLCNKKEGKQFQYYKNYHSLEDHFKSDHFLCHHPDCLEKRFVVFNSSQALKIHEVNTHIPKSQRRKGDSKISMDYSHSREHYRDHNQSTPQRQEQSRPQLSDFPTLGNNEGLESKEEETENQNATAPTNAPFLSEWSKVASHVTEEFPALAGEILGPQNLNGWASRPQIIPDQQKAQANNNQQNRNNKVKGQTVPKGPDFPTLSSANGNRNHNQSWGKPTNEDVDKDGFLRLGRTSQPSQTSNSLSNSGNKPLDVNSNDFPSMGGNNNAKKPVASTWGAPKPSTGGAVSTTVNNPPPTHSGKKSVRESKKEETFFLFGKK